jgi:putative effector of murein hydrolase LrgA (UPF0299 family)
MTIKGFRKAVGFAPLPVPNRATGLVLLFLRLDVQVKYNKTIY